MPYSSLYASAYITSSETHSKCWCIYHLDMLEGIDQGPVNEIEERRKRKRKNGCDPLGSAQNNVRKKHSYEVHQPSFCLCGHNGSFILRALKKDMLGTGRAPSVQHRHSGALSVLSVWQSAHAIKQHSLPAKTCLCPSFNQ
ncbi:hypothetical protein QQF64_028358 [Cirrhinus molitorella]|uniref:Uncharacterized protein n=1 Tax=Cirrhinus molitorella TaxID=172907 RepID=A0ABR3N6T1_9TELE